MLIDRSRSHSAIILHNRHQRGPAPSDWAGGFHVPPSHRRNMALFNPKLVVVFRDELAIPIDDTCPERIPAGLAGGDPYVEKLF
jgi:hypothetical protein